MVLHRIRRGCGSSCSCCISLSPTSKNNQLSCCTHSQHQSVRRPSEAPLGTPQSSQSPSPAGHRPLCLLLVNVPGTTQPKRNHTKLTDFEAQLLSILSVRLDEDDLCALSLVAIMQKYFLFCTTLFCSCLQFVQVYFTRTCHFILHMMVGLLFCVFLVSLPFFSHPLVSRTHNTDQITLVNLETFESSVLFKMFIVLC